MGVRAKQTILDKTAKHFKDFDLPLDIDHKSYVAIVGPKVATSAIEVKRSFKAWKYLLLAIKKPISFTETYTARLKDLPSYLLTSFINSLALNVSLLAKINT